MNDGAKRVLDMGTGTGMWAMDYGELVQLLYMVRQGEADMLTIHSIADAHPDAEVIGVDLSPIQPG